MRLIVDPGIYEDDHREPACERPPWEMPANGTPAQKKDWRRRFIQWSCERLDERYSAEYERPQVIDKLYPATSRPFDPVESALESARCGRIEPLRRLYPHLAEFLHVRPGRGKHPRITKYRRINERQLAAWAVSCVRRVWQGSYGKTNRSIDPTAHDVVAEFIGAIVWRRLTGQDVTGLLNPSGS
jgi:hypothetical protein